MATFLNTIVTHLFLLALITIIMSPSIGRGVDAQSGCTSVLISMSPCLNYITGKSSTPSSPCCSSFDNVLKTQPACLCEVLNGDDSGLGISINKTLALTLPDACKIQTPPVSKCQADHSPAGSPGISPTGMPPMPSIGTPSPVSSSVEGRSKSTASTNDCSTKMSHSRQIAVFVGLVIAACFT